MRLLAVVTLSMLGSAVHAEEDGVFTYQMFEAAVQHVNLMDCPGDLAGEGRFCRMTMHNDAFHVFAFSEEGDQPMVGLKTWYEDEIALEFE